jgi:peptide/nickel transport system ATP-binding protein
MSHPALKITELSKTFADASGLLGRTRREVRAVMRVSLEVAPGETLGIVGESGCGKTTLARMLVGLTSPTDGRIEINGTDRTGDSTRRFGRDIQYVFQDPTSSLNPRMTIRDILSVPLRHLHGMDGPARAARISEIIDAVNLREEFLDRHPHEFSGGQAQRIGIARALAADARILVLDEPVSALDVSIQAQVLNLLADLKAECGLTYIFISHDLAVVEAISDRVAVFYAGSIAEIGPAEQIFAAPRHPYTKLLADSAPAVGKPIQTQEAALSDVQVSPTQLPGCSFAPRCAYASERCHSEPPALEAAGRHAAACFHPLD